MRREGRTEGEGEVGHDKREGNEGKGREGRKGGEEKRAVEGGYCKWINFMLVLFFIHRGRENGSGEFAGWGGSGLPGL